MLDDMLFEEKIRDWVISESLAALYMLENGWEIGRQHIEVDLTVWEILQI
jgi:hypothetical protein